MPQSITLERLGFQQTDRVVILHADDIGMCHATIPAFENLLDEGLTSSYSIMPPCPWASAALEIARQAGADVGVHITLTSEWQHYRWRPLSTTDRKSGLFDAEGFFPRDCDEIGMNASSDAARVEMQTQFQFFADRGVNPSHVDTHMGSSFYPKLLRTYVDTTLEYGVPALFPNPAFSFGWMGHASYELAVSLAPLLIERGFPTIDHVEGMPLSNDPASRDDEFEVRLETARAVLENIEPGITHFAFHPSVDTPELRAICPDWRSRVGDEHVFRSRELREFLQKEGIHVIGYRALKALIPVGSPSSDAVQ
jgi:chitin disaccharide deacetylase